MTVRDATPRRAAALTICAALVVAAWAGSAAAPARGAVAVVGVNDTYSVKHSRATTIPAPGVLSNDLNLIGSTTVSLTQGVTHGALSLRSDGGFTYTPDPGYVGTDSFRYQPSGLLSTGARVTITVTNIAPVARNDAYATPSRTTLAVPAPGLLGNDTDADGDSLVAVLDGGGVSGSLDVDADGSFVYTPGGGFNGTTSFTYRVGDGVAWSTATATISVAAPTPTPTPTPVPTPTPLLPLPSVPLPSVPPSLVPLPLPGAPSPSPAPSLPTLDPREPAPSPAVSPDEDGAPGATPRPGGQQPGDGVAEPRASTSGRSDEEPDGDGAPSAGSGAPPAGNRAPSAGGAPVSLDGPPLRIDSARGDVSVEIGGIDLLANPVWAVPAATIAGPGLLVLLWLSLQAVGAAAWMPSVRRLRGDDASQSQAP